MAILNTTDILGPNYGLIALMFMGLIGFIASIVWFIKTKSIALTILSAACVLLTACVMLYSSYCFVSGDYDVPTGEVQIEATFANGDIPAYYLKDYNVIDRRGNVYILEEK